MTALLHLLWWLLALLLLPLWLPLAWHTRRHALRLPVASGPTHGAWGECGTARPLRLLVLGESTVAGVGVEHQSEALAAQLAQSLFETEGAVSWRALGENGISVQGAATHLLPLSLQEPADLVVLVFGVNDCTHLSSRRAWRGGLAQMASRWRQEGARVAFTAVPPLVHFQALPWLLRSLLGWRATLLDRDLRDLARRLGAHYCALELPFTPECLARDGYHPSALGYRLWAQGLAAQLRACRRG